MKPRRVVVTGLGAITSAGAGVDAFWRALVGGKPHLRAASKYALPDATNIPVGEVSEPFPDNQDRAEAIALAATKEAAQDARLGKGDLRQRAGVALGTCLGSAEGMFAWIREAAGVSPTGRSAAGRRAGLGSPSARLASEYGMSGPVLTLSSACSSGTAAIAAALDCIRRGEADIMLTGGVDVLSEFVVSGFFVLGILTATCMRPFDRRRDGLALGEGAGMLVLEERDRAMERGATILAEIVGSGSALDAHRMTGPCPEGEGLARAITAAMGDAGSRPDSVEFISAHGTATPQNDRSETFAIKHSFGDSTRIPINSIKPITGHTLGAAGALEAIQCVKVIREGIVPPTAGCEEQDPCCDLDYVRGGPRRMEVGCALSISSGFAGHNAALLLVRP